MWLVDALQKTWEEMKIRYADFIVVAISWLPILLLGLLFFYLSTAAIPLGTLIDLRIKLLLCFGKSLIAVYLGELLWSILFPKLDGKKLMTDDLEQLPAKHYNIMYGRLSMHAILQLVVLGV